MSSFGLSHCSSSPLKLVRQHERVDLESQNYRFVLTLLHQWEITSCTSLYLHDGCCSYELPWSVPLTPDPISHSPHWRGCSCNSLPDPAARSQMDYRPGEVGSWTTSVLNRAATADHFPGRLISCLVIKMSSDVSFLSSSQSYSVYWDIN